MADRTVKVILTSDYRGLQQGLREGKREVGDFSRSVGSELGQAESKASQFARGVGTAAARATAATVAAGGAMTVSLAKVGVGYNSLEATSRKAMGTILGSATQASALMDDLFDFAQTSPFAREVFIQGAQQLTAFGTEAERVIPILSAVQDSVAAFGGSSQDVAELVNVLAKVRSQGKITAITLREFGVRGVDAATLIGNEMGMTGQQIRDSITAGTLDADEAIQALTDGMTARFGGAAEGLKEMWGGALQSITARWRNIGSDLAEPFVSAQGGGAAVDWANQLADMLSSLRGSVVPSLVPQLERAADAASRVVDNVERFVDSLSPADVARFMDQIRPMAPAISAVGAALTAAGAGSIRFLPSIHPAVAALAAMAATSPELRASLIELGSALADLAVAVAPVAAQLATMTSVLISDLAAPVVSALASALGVLATVLSHLEGPLIAVTLGFVGLKAATVGAGIVAALGKITAAIGVLNGVAATRGVSTMTAFGGVMRQSSAEAGGLSRMLLGVPAPVAAAGAAVGIAALAVHELGRDSRESAARVREMTDAMYDAGDASGGLTEFVMNAARESDQLRRTMSEAGVTAQEVADAALEGGTSWERMADKLRDAGEAAGLTGFEMMGLEAALANLPGEAQQAADRLDELLEIGRKAPGAMAGFLGMQARWAEGHRDVAAASEEQKSKLEDLMDTYRSFLDPVFAMQDALEKNEQANRDVLEAIEEHGRGSDRHIEAQRRATRSAMDVEGAMFALRDEVAKSPSKLDESMRALDRWVAEGWLTEEAAAAAKREILEMVAAAEAANRQSIHIDIQLGVSGAIQQAHRLMDIIHGALGSVSAPTSGGGTIRMARGGITPPHITGRQRIKYGEPETGGEAFVPRLGDRDRALGVLETAAAWHGAQVVPNVTMAPSPVMASTTVTQTVQVNGYNRSPESIIDEALWRFESRQSWANTGRNDR